VGLLCCCEGDDVLNSLFNPIILFVEYLEDEVLEIQRKKTRFGSDIATLTKSAKLFADQAAEKGGRHYAYCPVK